MGDYFIMERNYLTDLECAEVYLSEDTQALGYVLDEWFSSNMPNENFKYSFWELQNRLNLILRSMASNRDYMRKTIEEGYAEWKQNKEGDKCEI